MDLLTRMFTDPNAMEFKAFMAGLAAVVMCGVLSVLVVVKRLGFVGQGVSHSAFGGVGVASLLAVLLPASMLGASAAGESAWTVDLAQFAVISLFCIGAALGMAAISNRRTVPADTAIGMFLVGSMALGALLVHISRNMALDRQIPAAVQSWESILFGSIFLASKREVQIGWIVAAAVILAAWWFRRPLLFWVFDEDSSPAFGLRARALKTLLMVLLAVAVVIAMKLAGVVLATALLVLPGATALRLTRRLWPAVYISVASGIVSLLAGLLISVSLDWPPGPSVVAALTALFTIASLAAAVLDQTAASRRSTQGATAP